MMVDDELLELENLAKNTPSKYCEMTIIDENTGLKVIVDQSLDSSISGTSEQMESLIKEFIKIYLYWKDRKYNGEFDNINKIKINSLIIDFGNYKGEKALNWLIRYIKVILKMMDEKGNINLREIESNFRIKEDI
jgi:hypothetical protein